MKHFEHNGLKLCDGVSRRECLRQHNHDQSGRPIPLSFGEPVRDLLA